MWHDLITLALDAHRSASIPGHMPIAPDDYFHLLTYLAHEIDECGSAQNLAFTLYEELGDIVAQEVIHGINKALQQISVDFHIDLMKARHNDLINAVHL